MRPPQRPTLQLPSAPTLTSTPAHSLLPRQQVRHATLIRRPKRPYTFTQLITLSDGSTFLHRTTSPTPIHRSTRDTRNTPLWNPSNARMANVEEDEAGRLRAFRRRFGRAFDSSTGERGEDGAATGAPNPSGMSRDEASAAAAMAPGDGSADVGADVGADASVSGEGRYKSEAEKKARSDVETAKEDAGEATATSAAEATQTEANVRGQGRGTTEDSGWSDEGEDNLMDLISSYSGGDAQRQGGGAGARVVQRGVPGAGTSGKKKGGKGR